jgi:hypothetical protein
MIVKDIFNTIKQSKITTENMKNQTYELEKININDEVNSELKEIANNIRYNCEKLDILCDNFEDRMYNICDYMIIGIGR